MGKAAGRTAQRQSYHPDDVDGSEHHVDDDKLDVIRVPVALGANFPACKHTTSMIKGISAHPLG